MADTAPKKPRRTRTDYRRKFEELIQYAEISLQLIDSLKPVVGELNEPFMNGQAAALRAVLQKGKPA